jgi:hypothetical protein
MIIIDNIFEIKNTCPKEINAARSRKTAEGVNAQRSASMNTIGSFVKRSSYPIAELIS